MQFSNEIGDYTNEFRFMTTEIINERIKTMSFKGANWNITFEPSTSSITRLKYQSQYNSEDQVLTLSTTSNKKGNDLICEFGDPSSHAGKFVFHNLTTESLKYKWKCPVSQVSQVLSLSGDKTVQISDVGAMQIIVNSDIAEYRYIIIAQTK
jgi:hypothetical protein